MASSLAPQCWNWQILVPFSLKWACEDRFFPFYHPYKVLTIKMKLAIRIITSLRLRQKSEIVHTIIAKKQKRWYTQQSCHIMHFFQVTRVLTIIFITIANIEHLDTRSMLSQLGTLCDRTAKECDVIEKIDQNHRESSKKPSKTIRKPSQMSSKHFPGTARRNWFVLTKCWVEPSKTRKIAHWMLEASGIMHPQEKAKIIHTNSQIIKCLLQSQLNENQILYINET